MPKHPGKLTRGIPLAKKAAGQKTTKIRGLSPTRVKEKETTRKLINKSAPKRGRRN
jgi:hypothetical protein